MPPEDTAVDEGALLSSLLQIAKPEEKQVTPPEPEKKPEAAAPTTDATPKPDAATAPETKPEEKKPEPTPAPAKKARVVKREPAPVEIPEEKVEAIVKKTLAAQKPEPKPEPAPVKEELPADLTPEEREELDLVGYVEKSDTSKAGLKQKYLKFYAEQRKFLEKRLADEGDDYDPTTDAQYKRWLAANSPRLSAVERQKFVTQRIAEEAEQRAVEKVKKEYQPKIAETERKLREIAERPKINQRIERFVGEVSQGMPQEMHDFYEANGRDMNKLKEAFPDEFEIVSKTVDDTLKFADEFLSVRHGLRDLDLNDPEHSRIVEFIDARAQAFQRNGGPALVRGGKQFVHPFKWPESDPNKHWTFENEDVLAMLKLQAQRDAKKRIDDLHKRIDAALEARKRRAGAQKSDTTAQPKDDTGSPKVTTPPASGAAPSAAPSDSNIVAKLLKLGST